MQGCTQAFARLENAGLHRVRDGLCWELGSRLLLEWWGGGDCVVLFMGPLRRMRREAGGGRGGSEGMPVWERESVRMSRGQTAPRITPRLSPTSSCLPASVNFAGPTRRAAQVSARVGFLTSGHRPAQRLPATANGCIRTSGARADSNAMA